MIYFIQGEITRRIKIGYTDCDIFEERFQPIKSSSPDLLVFLGGIPGDRQREKEIHDQFKKYHSHGEWFNENQPLYEFIDENCIKTIHSLEIVIPEIDSGRITLSRALEMSDEEISNIQSERIAKAYKGLFQNVKLPESFKIT